jgi:hypothetical protein
VCDQILSLPLYPRLDDRAISVVAGALATGPAPAIDRVQAAER